MISTADKQAIAETLALQATLVDEDRLERLDDVFTPDVTYDMSSSHMGVFEGLETVRAAAAALHGSGSAPLSHSVTNVIVSARDGDEDGTSATVRSKGLMIMHDGCVHAVVYDDDFVQHEGRWRIARRVILPVGSGADAGH